MAQSRGLVADFLFRHLRLQIERVGAECARGVGKTRGADLQSAAIVAGVGGSGEVSEAVFVENGGISRIGGGGLVAGLGRALHPPSPELCRQQSRQLRRWRGSRRVRRQRHSQENSKKHRDSDRTGDAHPQSLIPGPMIPGPVRSLCSLDHKPGAKVSEGLQMPDLTAFPAGGYHRAPTPRSHSQTATVGAH